MNGKIICINKFIHKVVLSNNTKVIHQLAFYGCSALKTIRLPNGLQKIDSEAFKYGSASVVSKELC